MRLYLGIKVFFFSLVVIFELFLCLAVGHLIYDLTITSGPGQLLMVTFILTLPLLFIGVFIASIAHRHTSDIFDDFRFDIYGDAQLYYSPFEQYERGCPLFLPDQSRFWLTKGYSCSHNIWLSFTDDTTGTCGRDYFKRDFLFCFN